MSTKTLFKLLWVPFVTSVFASCSDKEELPYTPPEETNDSYISPAVPQGNSWPEASMSLTQPFLGAGYDIMGSYIDNNSVKEPVLDLSKIDNEKISNLVGSSGVGDSFIGRDMKEFLRSITEYKKFVVPAENKDDLLFTATITGHTYFQKPYDYSSQYTFAFGSSGANGVIQRLLTLNADWSNWLADDFRQELEDASPETIIELFGTHILVNTHLGYTSKTLYRSIVADDEENLLRTANTGMGAHQSSIIKHPNISITYPEETVKKNYGGTIVVSLQGADYKVFDQLTGDPMDIKQMLHAVGVLAQLEEVGLFLGVLNLAAAVGALAVNELALGPEALAGLAVLALVGALVDVAVVVHLPEDLLDGLDMVVIRCADEAVVRNIHELPQIEDALFAADDVVDELLRGHARGLGLVLDLLTVLVRAGQEHHVVAGQALVARHRVGRHRAVGVANVQLVRRVVNGRGDIESFLFHGYLPLFLPAPNESGA